MRPIIADIIIDAEAEQQKKNAALILRRRAAARHLSPIMVVNDDCEVY